MDLAADDQSVVTSPTAWGITSHGRVTWQKRRQFIVMLSAWPLVARAQQSALTTVGFLRSSTFADVQHWVTAFRQGLKEGGFVEGQNVAIEYRSADNQPDRLPALCARALRPISKKLLRIIQSSRSGLAIPVKSCRSSGLPYSGIRVQEQRDKLAELATTLGVKAAK
jgi:hypothetical protein